eukprot:6664236-Prymnesium_polylepis.1
MQPSHVPTAAGVAAAAASSGGGPTSTGGDATSVGHMNMHMSEMTEAEQHIDMHMNEMTEVEQPQRKRQR